ncbi:MAG: rhomboid family intramembrane serine protease [Leadbetterella sp.]|nr:rhomboid family intramembrane serine protease [Leadbetterella sp.]
MFSNLTPMVKNLLIVNIVIHLLANLVPNDFIRQIFSFYNPVLPGTAELWNPNFKPWQIITYMFLHSRDTFMHLFSNMFALLIFGPAIEAYMGSGKFLKYYIICGVGAAFFNMGMDYFQFFQSSQSDAQLQFLAIKACWERQGPSLVSWWLSPCCSLTLKCCCSFFPCPLRPNTLWHFTPFLRLYRLSGELLQALPTGRTSAV